MEYTDTVQKRRVERIALSLPVRVEAKESEEISWYEITHFNSLSSCGAGFELRHQVRIGQLLLLTAPIPQKLRCFDYLEQQYRVWGIVRHCYSSRDNSTTFQTGVALIGKHPPLSYQKNPGKLYNLHSLTQQGLYEIDEMKEDLIENEVPTQQIKIPNPRYPIPVEVFLEVLDQNSNTIAYETTVSENVSLCGTSVFSSLDVQIKDIIRVNFTIFNVSILAMVRNRRTGQDGMSRLHLQFIDRHLPLEGME